MFRWALGALVLASSMLVASFTVAAGGCHPTATSSEARGTIVDIKGCGFAPVVLFAPTGATVRWMNADPFPHNVVGVGWGTTEYLASSAGVEHTFKAAGVYPYQCSVHPGMAGVVIIGDVPDAAAAAPEPTALVAGATRSDSDRTGVAVAGGVAALALTAALGFAVGRRRRAV